MLAALVRGRPGFRWALAALVMWVTIVAPVNGRVEEAMRSAPETVPALWMQQRERWECGHAAGFVVQLAGLCALVVSVLSDTAARSPR